MAVNYGTANLARKRSRKMKRSVKKEYEYKRSYDYADFDTKNGRKFVKKRSHKRLRKQLEVEK